MIAQAIGTGSLTGSVARREWARHSRGWAWCCLRRRMEGVNCPFPETVMIKFGDTRHSWWGKIKDVNIRSGPYSSAFRYQLIQPDSPAMTLEPTLGFLDWEPECGTTALRQDGTLPTTRAYLSHPYLRAVELYDSMMGRPTLTISFTISCLLVLNLCITVLCMVTLSQVQVPAWCLTGSNGCDNDSMPGGTTSCRWAWGWPRRHVTLNPSCSIYIFSAKQIP